MHVQCVGSVYVFACLHVEVVRRCSMCLNDDCRCSTCLNVDVAGALCVFMLKCT